MLKKIILLLSTIIFLTGIFYFFNLYLKKNIKNTSLYGKVTAKENFENFLFKKVERDQNNWRRDPFIQNYRTKGKTSKIYLDEEINIEAIVTGDKNYAIVNGKIVKRGDKIGDYQVISIQKHKIIFSKNGTKKELYIY